MTCSRRSWFLRPPSQFTACSRCRSPICQSFQTSASSSSVWHLEPFSKRLHDIPLYGRRRPPCGHCCPWSRLPAPTCSFPEADSRLQNYAATDVITVLRGDNAGASLILTPTAAVTTAAFGTLFRIGNQIKSSLGITLQCMHLRRMLKAPLVPACASTCLT